MITQGFPLGVLVPGAGGGTPASFAVDTDGDLVSKLLFYSRQDDGTDASGNAAAATVTDVTYSAQKIGNGATYNGSTSSMNFGNVLDFERTDSRSWSFWFKWSAGGNLVIMSKGMTTGHTAIGWSIAVNQASTNGEILLGLNGATSYNVSEMLTRIKGAGYDDGTLRHVVITYSGNSSSSGVEFYVDGAHVSRFGDYANNLANSISNSANLYIGRDPAGAYFDGALDEIAMFSGVLSANNIADMYNSGSGNAFTSAS